MAVGMASLECDGQAAEKAAEIAACPKLGRLIAGAAAAVTMAALGVVAIRPGARPPSRAEALSHPLARRAWEFLAIASPPLTMLGRPGAHSVVAQARARARAGEAQPAQGIRAQRGPGARDLFDGAGLASRAIERVTMGARQRAVKGACA